MLIYLASMSPNPACSIFMGARLMISRSAMMTDAHKLGNLYLYARRYCMKRYLKHIRPWKVQSLQLRVLSATHHGQHLADIIYGAWSNSDDNIVAISYHCSSTNSQLIGFQILLRIYVIWVGNIACFHIETTFSPAAWKVFAQQQKWLASSMFPLPVQVFPVQNKLPVCTISLTSVLCLPHEQA